MLSVPNTAIAWVAHEAADPNLLTSAETKLAERYLHPGRLAQFCAGRIAAHQALVEAGCSQSKAEVLAASSGAPTWPSGFVGSLSHSQTHAVAIVGSGDHYSLMGIDIEPFNREVRSEIARRICTPTELPWAQSSTSNLLKVFSAKEAIYKAISPTSERPPRFSSVELFPQPGSTHLIARLTETLSPVLKENHLFWVLSTLKSEHLITIVVS